MSNLLIQNRRQINDSKYFESRLTRDEIILISIREKELILNNFRKLERCWIIKIILNCYSVNVKGRPGWSSCENVICYDCMSEERLVGYSMNVTSANVLLLRKWICKLKIIEGIIRLQSFENFDCFKKLCRFRETISDFPMYYWKRNLYM